MDTACAEVIAHSSRAEAAELHVAQSNTRLAEELASLREQLRQVGSSRSRGSRPPPAARPGLAGHSLKEADDDPRSIGAPALEPRHPASSRGNSPNVGRGEAGGERLRGGIGDLAPWEPAAQSNGKGRAIGIARGNALSSGNGVCRDGGEPLHESLRMEAARMLPDGHQPMPDQPEELAPAHVQRHTEAENCAKLRARIATLQQSITVSSGRASRAKAQLHVVEEETAQLKDQLLAQLERFDESAAALKMEGPSFDVRSTLQRRRQRFPVNRPWDWLAFNDEISEKASTCAATMEGLRAAQALASSGQQELEEESMQLLQRTAVARQLQTEVQETEDKCRQEVQALQRRAENWRHQLESDMAARSNLKARLGDFQQRSWSEGGRIRAESDSFDAEAEHLAALVAHERAEAAAAAADALPREEVLDQLEQRDAATWRLNEQLVQEWREEQSAEHWEETERKAAKSAREELSEALEKHAAQEAAELQLRTTWQEKSQILSSRHKALTGRDGRPSSHASTGSTRGASDDTPQHGARSLFGHAAAVHDERADFFSDAMQERHARPRAAIAGAAAQPPALAMPSAPCAASSGLERALLAWDSVFTATTLESPAAQLLPPDSPLLLTDAVMRVPRASVARTLDAPGIGASLWPSITAEGESRQAWAEVAEAEGRRIASLAVHRAGMGSGVVN